MVKSESSLTSTQVSKSEVGLSLIIKDFRLAKLEKQRNTKAINEKLIFILTTHTNAKLLTEMKTTKGD